MRGMPSTPWFDAACTSKTLCCSTRAWYAVSPTVTACVDQCSAVPSASVQSNTSSGVSVTACSFSSKMVDINDMHRAGMPIHVRSDDVERVIGEPRPFVNTAAHAVAIDGRRALCFHLQPENVDGSPRRNLQAERGNVDLIRQRDLLP